MSETIQDQSTETQASIGAIEDVALDVRMRVIAQLASGQGSIEEVLRELASAVGKKVSFTQAEEGEVQILVEETSNSEGELSAEAQTRLLATLKARFEAHPERHKGMNWTDVQKSLEIQPTLLWSLNEMEKAGHAPDVFSEDEGAYIFGTCSEESPESARNIVYDKAAQDWLAQNHPAAICNGNAVDLASAMGINLMTEEQYRLLQKLGKFDKNSWSWLKTFDEIRKSGYALYGARAGEDVYVYRDDAYDHSQDRAFRGSLRVPKFKT